MSNVSNIHLLKLRYVEMVNGYRKSLDNLRNNISEAMSKGNHVQADAFLITYYAKSCNVYIYRKFIKELEEIEMETNNG